MAGSFAVSIVSRDAAPLDPGMRWLVLAGATSIGWASDQTVVITSGLVRGGTAARPLQPTARPLDDRPPRVEGVVALREFDLAASDWDEFLALSVSAWPAFETAYDATILGLFRFGDVAPPDAAALLVTRYASLAEWELSRGVGTASGDLAEAGRRFARRHQLTRRTSVRIGRPAATS